MSTFRVMKFIFIFKITSSSYSHNMKESLKLLLAKLVIMRRRKFWKPYFPSLPLLPLSSYTYPPLPSSFHFTPFPNFFLLCFILSTLSYLILHFPYLKATSLPQPSLPLFPYSSSPHFILWFHTFPEFLPSLLPPLHTFHSNTALALLEGYFPSPAITPAPLLTRTT